MSKSNSKKLIALGAVIALVAILGVCLVACNAQSYEKKLTNKGYKVTVYSKTADNVEWELSAVKAVIGANSSADVVDVCKYKETKDAKDAEANWKKANKPVYRTGKIVIFGSEQGVKDAK